MASCVEHEHGLPAPVTPAKSARRSDHGKVIWLLLRNEVSREEDGEEGQEGRRQEAEVIIPGSHARDGRRKPESCVVVSLYPPRFAEHSSYHAAEKA